MERIPCFDAHCDTVSACLHTGRSLRQNPGQLDLERLRAFSPAAQIFAIFADSARYDPDGLWAEVLRQKDFFFSEMARNDDLVRFCRTGGEIRAAVGADRIAALLSVEGGELLDCDPGRLEEAAAWGVRCVNLTWNHENALSGSHREGPDRGLTARGRDFVRKAESLGVLVDVSHLSDAGFWDLARIAARPIVATHSDARAVSPHSRNLTDDMFRAIRDTGGCAGLNLYTPFIGGGAMDDVLRHVEHFLSLDGEKTLCLGGDLDGCDSLAGGLRGAQDMPLLWDALAARGYDRALMEDIFFNNLLRVLEN